MTPNGARWSGKVQLDIGVMKKVLKWRKSKRIFVCDMSDLFYEEVPDEFIERVFAIMAVAQQHQFQLLTKRPERMRGIMSPDFVRPSTSTSSLPIITSSCTRD